MGRRSLIVVGVFAALLMIPAQVMAAPGGAKGPKEKVTICHIPPGNPGNAHTITVGAPAEAAHLAHGDTKGACSEERPSRDQDEVQGNRRPVADAGDNQCVLYGTRVRLDGSDSDDPDDDELDFEWDVVDTPSGSSVSDGSLSDDDIAKPTFTPDRLGRYEFDLRVEDEHGLSDTDTVLVRTKMDVALDAADYDVDEGESVRVTISLHRNAPEDVTVEIDIDTDVAVVAATASGPAIDEVEIDAGDDDVRVWLRGIDAGDTDLTVSTGSTGCSSSDTADVDVKSAASASASLAVDELQMVLLRFWHWILF